VEGYQFGHLETWSVAGSTGSPHHAERRANGDRAWTAAEILDEAERAPGASFHVEPGGEAPQILPGAVASFDELRAAHAAAAETRESFDYTDPKTGAKGARNRKLRRDARTLFTAVFSLPVETATARADPALRARCVGLLETTIAHEANRIGALGGTVMMGVVHWDERMVHAHLYAIDPARGRVDHLHPGRAAKRAFEADPSHVALEKAERNKGGNRAYCAAMRAWQDRLHREVFHGHGLLRVGPRRERLSRADYQHAKQVAAARRDDVDRQERLEALERTLDRREARVATREVAANAAEGEADARLAAVEVMTEGLAQVVEVDGRRRLAPSPSVARSTRWQALRDRMRRAPEAAWGAAEQVDAGMERLRKRIAWEEAERAREKAREELAAGFARVEAAADAVRTFWHRAQALLERLPAPLRRQVEGEIVPGAQRVIASVRAARPSRTDREER
jgi:hypothetical protein